MEMRRQPVTDVALLYDEVPALPDIAAAVRLRREFGVKVAVKVEGRFQVVAHGLFPRCLSVDQSGARFARAEAAAIEGGEVLSQGRIQAAAADDVQHARHSGDDRLLLARRGDNGAVRR